MTVPRIAVTGLRGQVAASLRERAEGRADIVLLGRPHLDLADRDSVFGALAAAHCDVIVNAAAYTAVDKAEQEPEEAMRINAAGAGHVADAAARLDAPLLHISTDYVFDGGSDRPYVETDPPGPTTLYGRSKLEGEARVLAAWPNSVVLRTAWIYSPFGANFVRTMLRLAEARQDIAVVADQRGNPTSALDLADALLQIALRVVENRSPDLRGVFHITGRGEATWADLAEAVFREAEQYGRPPVRVRRITTAEYPTPARRPANSRLDNGRLARAYGMTMPDWRPSLADCVRRLLSTKSDTGAS